MKRVLPICLCLLLFAGCVTHQRAQGDYCKTAMDLAEGEQTDDQKIVSLFNRCFAVNPAAAKNQVYLYERGMSLFYEEKYELARQDFQQIIDLNYDHSRAQYMLGRVHTAKHDNWRAIEQYTISLELDDSYAWAWAYRGYEYSKVSEKAKALADFDKAIALDGSESWFYRMRSILHEENGDIDAAFEQIGIAISINDESYRNYSVRGNLYADQEQWLAAIWDYSESIQIEPEYYVIRERGKARYAIGDYEGTIKDFEAVNKLVDNYHLGYFYIGLANCMLGRFDDAIHTLNSAVWGLNRDEIYHYRGLAHEAIGKYEKAKEDYSSEFNNSDNANGLISRALVKQFQGDLAGACEDMDEAVEFNRNEPKWYAIRGSIRMDRGDRKGAMQDANTAIGKMKYNDDYMAMNGEQKIAFLYMARGLHRLNNLQRTALDDFDKVLQLDPTSLNALEGRAEALYLWGDTHRAYADLSESIEGEPKARRYYKRGMMYYKDGEYSRAVSDFTEAIAMDPAKVQYYIDRARAHKANGNLEAGKDDMQRARKIELDGVPM